MTSLQFGRILPIIKKEFVHISRDFRTLAIVILMPVAMLFLYGYAINLEIQNVDIFVLDRSKTPVSSALVQKFDGSAFFTVSYSAGSEAGIETLFATRKADMALVIPRDFSARIARERSTAVQILIDASNPNAAHAIRNYTEAVIAAFNQERNGLPQLRVEPTVWYNPGLKSAYFFVPGLAALIMIMVSALLTSIAVAREKETGTMEQILVSPIRPLEIIVGKVVPYIVLALVDLAIILCIAHFVFAVPFLGPLWQLVLASLLFIFVALSLGLLISTRARTQQVAMMVALVATLLPTVMLSGFIFPIASLPLPLKLVSHVVPARYFLVIIRGIMLKGNSFSHLFMEISVLLCMGLGLLLIAARKFKTNLEA